MGKKVDWLQVLVQCKENIREDISPLLLMLSQPQPDLGIGAGGDALRRTDLAAENAIVNTLKEHEVSFTLVSEESGVKEYGKNPHDCYVTTDPIDGTTNLTRGIPFYATSIAISTKPTLDTINTALVTDLFHDIHRTERKGSLPQQPSNNSVKKHFTRRSSDRRRPELIQSPENNLAVDKPDSESETHTSLRSQCARALLRRRWDNRCIHRHTWKTSHYRHGGCLANNRRSRCKDHNT